MLQAILHGKAGRLSSEFHGTLSWRDLFRKREDLLTAVFFGRLQHLSEQGENRVLALLVGRELANRLGVIEDIVYWPKLYGLQGRHYVEPDLILIFKQDLLLVEIKPPFGGSQSEQQWRDEILSLIAQRNKDNAPFEIPETFHFLALGRNVSGYHQWRERLLEEFRDKGLASASIHGWGDVCHGIHELHEDESGRDRHIYREWVDAFQLFGMIERPRPFDELLPLMNFDYTGWDGYLEGLNIHGLAESAY